MARREKSRSPEPRVERIVGSGGAAARVGTERAVRVAVQDLFCAMRVVRRGGGNPRFLLDRRGLKQHTELLRKIAEAMNIAHDWKKRVRVPQFCAFARPPAGEPSTPPWPCGGSLPTWPFFMRGRSLRVWHASPPLVESWVVCHVGQVVRPPWLFVWGRYAPRPHVQVMPRGTVPLGKGGVITHEPTVPTAACDAQKNPNDSGSHDHRCALGRRSSGLCDVRVAVAGKQPRGVPHAADRLDRRCDRLLDHET